MKQRVGVVNRTIRIFMAGAGMALVVLLLGKIAGKAAGAIPREELEQTARNEAVRCMEFFWDRVYPAGNGYKSAGTAGDGGEDAAWYVRAVLGRVPLYRYLMQKEKEDGGYREADPSYRVYRESEKFYEEHQYLAWYGGEETNLASGGPETGAAGGKAEPPVNEGSPGPVEVLGPVDPASTPAYTVREGLPVTGTRYVMEQLADYDFLMKHFYSVHTSTTVGRDLMNAEKFLSQDFALEGDNTAPQILIYHTHSQETFADYGPNRLEATVVGMGDYLTRLLTDKGYRVIHDKSVYDLKDGKLDRNKAYTYALEGITRILQENPSVEVILDLHRDGVQPGLHLVSEVNGKATAPIMFFNGVSQTPEGPIEYLPNPYREDNLAFSLQMQVDAAAYYPGLTRKIYIKGLRYNMHLRPRSALVEVGAQTNTYQEALNAMEPLSELLDMVLQGN